MLELRRRGLYSGNGYITDGLVFELNASKGLSEEGWIEQIGGKKFTWTEGSDKVFSDYGVHIGSNVGTNGSFMECENTSFNWVARSQYTLELTFKWIEKIINAQVFNTGVLEGFSYTTNSNGSYHLCGVTQNGCWMRSVINPNQFASRITMNYNDGIFNNGEKISNATLYDKRSTTSTAGDKAMLGCNSNGTYPVSDIIIRAIRIYNRPLTIEEMKHNFDIDTKLFNL